MWMQNLDWQFADIHNTRTATLSHLHIYIVRGGGLQVDLSNSKQLQKWNEPFRSNVTSLVPIESATVQRNLNGFHFEETSIIDIYPL